MKDFNKEKRYERAKERVEELKKFYNNLFSYVIIIGFLAGLNYYQNEWHYAWFLWAAFGWGIGLAFHAVKAYRINPMFDKDWEDRKIREYMDEEQGQEQQRWE
ncbi:2TM domain-containing protein [Aquimarina sp. MAR_2010_214]|uniref:2TM domain-containing protein n=1 Tax=Aquimarina sp. MAR_2010_214 TaxID=1250026 RepID=UPI000C708C61|nr:2TM domain-containing protein [Aquimarina sp. MAR_2010_214]PKV50370.1 2TM domain-containing protein [Aquimarina sp. MAR_2010_214]